MLVFLAVSTVSFVSATPARRDHNKDQASRSLLVLLQSSLVLTKTSTDLWWSWHCEFLT